MRKTTILVAVLVFQAAGGRASADPDKFSKAVDAARAWLAAAPGENPDDAPALQNFRGDIDAVIDAIRPMGSRCGPDQREMVRRHGAISVDAARR